MNCKNCESELSENNNYCSECGAKVIDRRLTIGFFISELRENFFSIDSNRPLRTLIDLVFKPATVIDGYINGVRKKYLNPFGYFTLAITLSGIFYYVLNNFFPELLEATVNFGDRIPTEEEKEAAKNTFSTIFEYQTFIFFLSVPIMALLSKLIFLKNKKYNYIEHLIINLYAYSTTSIILVSLYFLTFWNVHLYQIASFFGSFLLLGYYVYVLQQLYNLSALQTILKTILFLAILFTITIVIIVILYSTGALDKFIEQAIEQAKQRKATAYIASSVINWTS
ncbi:MAG: DUF3667 domain-containing protein [Patiriisocius sp.]|uniref:DUF3667 domain-containing protein n=1 Tax=Patiriisocius sp. TaxID=2822396 RepID=UPI003EF57241